MTEQDKLIKNIAEKAVDAFKKSCDEFTKAQLKKLGFEFENEKEYSEFCEARLTIVSYTERPNYKELYLDIDTPNEKPVGCWDEAMDVKIIEGKINFTIG